MRLALTITAVGTVGIGLFPNFFINAANWSLGLVQGSQHMAALLRELRLNYLSDPPGRDGETGRRSGLKIRRPERVVGVQVPLPAPPLKTITVNVLGNQQRLSLRNPVQSSAILEVPA